MLKKISFLRLLYVSMVICLFGSFLPDFSAFAQPLSPIGNWKLDDGSGTIATDNSGNGNDGTIYGATWTTGKVNSALSFNGSGNHVEIPDAPSLAFPNQVTIALWVYSNNLSADWITLMHRTNSAFNWFDWQFYARAKDAQTPYHPVFRVNWNNDNQLTADEEVEGDIILSPNTWYFIAVTYDGNQMKFYIDGTLRGTTDKVGATIPNGGRNIWIGGNDKWGEYFNGILDEVYLYNGALSQSEIQNLMTGAPVQYTLNVNVIGNGTVTKVPDQSNYNLNDIVQLTANPASGWTFSGWSGDLTETVNPSNITMDGNKTVTATFTQPSVSGFFEDFNSFTVGQTVGNSAEWYDGGGGPVVNSTNGLLGSQGLAPANNIFTWTAHSFDWNAADFQAVILQMDFESDPSGNFDDDRMGWMLSNSSTSSSDIFGVQLDQSDGGIVTYWRNSSDTRIQTPIVPLTSVSPNTWFRFWAKITKLTSTSAKIDVSLTQLDASGNPTGTPYTGSVENTSTWSGGIPDERYFTSSAPYYPAYKNFNAIEGDADNAYFELLTQTPVTEKFAFAVMSDLHTSSNQSAVQSNLQQVKYLVDHATTDMPAPSFLVVTGDFPNVSQTEASIDLVLGSGFLWYPVIGNHEISDDINNFYNIRDVMVPSLPNIFSYGPAGSINTNYSWNYGNTHFVAVNAYWDGTTGTNADHTLDGDIVPALDTWIQSDVTSAAKTHTYAFVHEPAYPDHRHVGDALDAHPANRDAFVTMLNNNNVDALFAGHTHYYEHDVASEFPLLGNVHQITTARGGDYPTSNGPNIVYVVIDGNSATYRAYSSSSSLPFPLIEEWTVVNGTPEQYSLTVNTTGSGSITKVPDKLLYDPEESVQLTATPTSGYIFTGWTGAIVETTNPVTVTMTGNLTITANFVEETPSTEYIETFESGFTLGQDVGNNVNWFDGSDDNGSDVQAGAGVAGSIGLAPGQWISTWLAHPFTWQDPNVLGVELGMDFQTDASGHFDDDRVGWMIVNNDNSSDNIFGVQMDPGGTGYNIECYWDGDTFGDNGGRTSIVSLPTLPGNSWYRLRATFTKLTNTSAKIDVFLYAIDEYGTVGNLVVSGTIDNTSLLPNTSENEIPNNAYFNASTMWPAYKNYQAIEGGADNAYFKILTTTPSTQYNLTVNTVGNGSVTKNPDLAQYNENTIVELTAVPDAGWIFSGWSGDLTGSTNPANITMNSNKTVTATFTETGAVTRKVAYNDLNPVSGDQNASFVTEYTYAASNAVLNDSATGAPLPWTITGTTIGGYDPNHPTNGGQANAGTEAGNIFGPAGAVIVDMNNTIELDAADWDNIITFNNLDPNKIYNITLSANRDNTSYTNQRFARVTIEGADAYTNASSIGVIVYSEASVSFSVGYNTANGYVARWTGIQTGADGSFSIKSEWDNSQDGDKGYAMTAFRLEEISTGPVQQYTLTTNVTGNGSITKNPDQAQYDENAVVQLTAVPDVGWEFSGWSGDLSGSDNPANITMSANKTVTATFVEVGPSPGWIAFNDCVFDPTKLGATTDPNGITVHYIGDNVSTFGIGNNFTGSSSGQLIKHSDGTNTGVTVTLTQSGGVVWQPDISSAWNGGYDTKSGTDAYNTFHGIADMTGVIYYGSTGWYVDLTFTGLDPNKEYNFVTSAARCNPSYTNRWTIYTLNGADTYTNASSSGVDVLATNQVRFNTGDNFNEGYVAKWTGIKAADGSFSVRAEADPSSESGYKAYSFDVFMLEEVGGAVEQHTLTINTTGNGSVTKNPDKTTYDLNEVVELTAVPDAGWTFNGWSSDLSGSTNPANITMDGDKTVTATFTQQLSNVWDITLTVSNNSENKTLNFGKNESATDGIDNSLLEAELPPVPPTGTFDARFILPVVPSIASLRDYRDADNTYLRWKVSFQPGESGYPIIFSWDNAAVAQLLGDFYLRDAITGNLVNVDMKTQSSYTLDNSALTSLIIEQYTEPLQLSCMDIPVNAGWNIVSVPYNADYMTPSALFPDAVSPAFGFDNGYINESTLENGKGYWIKFNSAELINICGVEVNDPVPVKSGWNMIGPYNANVPVNQLTTTPGGIISSDIFGFNDGYYSASTLESGKGYWVKVSQDGTISLNGVVPKTASNYSQPSVIDKNNGRIIITDKMGKSATLYSLPAPVKGSELPPVPPEGIFDIRYSTNTLAENFGQEGTDIKISSAVYPLRIKADGMQIRITDKIDGSLLNKLLPDGDEYIITNEGIKTIQVVKEAVLSNYVLEQNYPNPFNPSTRIRFSIPENGKVKISLFNVLGEKVAELLNRELSAGYHEIEFNAAGLSSAIYFYRMESGSFISVKKLILLK